MASVVSADPLDFSAFDSFEHASTAILDRLQAMLGFGLWMTTRTNEPEWVVLQACDQSYDVVPGTVFNWADSFCSRMVKGEGPHVAPNAADIAAYASAPIGKQVTIGAYVGVPMLSSDGSLLGTLCAIDPSPKDGLTEDEFLQVQLYARILGTLLDRDLKLAALERENLRLVNASTHDSLSKVINRRGWDEAVKQEDARLKRYGSPLTVFIVDIDNLKKVNDNRGHASGDILIEATANCLKSTFRSSDLVARIGGDEFGVLAVELANEAAGELFEKLCRNLTLRSINASAGYAVHRAGETIAETQARADANMYQMKTGRRR